MSTELTIYDHASPFDPNGYYPVVGNDIVGIALCVDCADNGDRMGAAIEGDEWEPISYHHETDCPVHCDSCEALIFTTLTKDGQNYVVDAIIDGSGRAEVKRAWMTAWPTISQKVEEEMQLRGVK